MGDVFEQLDAGIANAKKQRRLDIVLSQATKSGMSSKDLIILAAKNKVADDPNFIAMYNQLKADETAKQTQQQDAEFNMKAGTALNQEIGRYLKENPSASPMQSLQSGAIKNDTIPTPQGASSFALGSDSFNDNLSNFAKQLQGESSLGGIPTEQSEQPTSQLKPVTDTETAYNGIMKGIPVDIAQDLIFKYHNGLIKPKDFLKEVAAIKKSMYDISVEENKANQASKRAIELENRKSQNDIEKQYVVNEGPLELAGVNNEAQLQRQREENASKERVASLNAETSKSNAYSERTRALGPVQTDNLISFDDAEAQINTVKNLYDKNYTGFVKGRFGSVKDFFGALPEKEAAFRSAKQKFDNAMIKLQAGGAVTAQEATRMTKELGDFTKGPEQFNAVLDRTLSTIGNSKSIYINGLKKSKRDVGEWGNEVAPIDYSGGMNKQDTPKPALGLSATDKLKARAASGDPKAQNWLKSKGLAW